MSESRTRFKFDWCDAIYADGRINASERFVLVGIALRYARQDQNWQWHVRQKTIAAKFAIPERTVRRAMKSARDYGYMELVAERGRGRTHHGADEYRLKIPELGASRSPSSEEEIPANLAANSEEIPARSAGNTGQDCTKYRPDLTEIAAKTNSPASENDVPKGLYKGLEKGLERGGCAERPGPDGGSRLPAVPDTPSLSHDFSQEEKHNPAVFIEAEIVADDPDPEPEYYCAEHRPYGVGEPCGPCKTARLNYEAWSKRWLDRALEAHRNSPPPPPPTIPECQRHGICDGRWILGDDGLPVEPARKCDHQQTRKGA